MKDLTPALFSCAALMCGPRRYVTPALMKLPALTPAQKT